MATQVNYASSSLGDDELERRFEEALAALRATTSPVEPQLIGVHEIREGPIVERFDPCAPRARVAAAHEATAEHVAAAVATARAQTKSWRNTPYAERIARLRAARVVVADRIIELAAIVSAETGKTRLEAVGEAQEVLDMIEHYCGLMENNHGYCAPLKSTDTETNLDVLVPWGAFAVIAPYNFPVALAVGMMIGALVTGNTVVLKPSDKTPRSTATVAGILRDELPTGVLNVVHGGGRGWACPRGQRGERHRLHWFGEGRLGAGQLDGFIRSAAARARRNGRSEPSDRRPQRRSRRGNERHRTLRIRALRPEMQRMSSSGSR